MSPEQERALAYLRRKGTEAPVEWIEELDWKAYALALKVHTLEHRAQVERTLAAGREAGPAASE